jgi:thiosulfate dehydrogenase (quinone) large subunit
VASQGAEPEQVERAFPPPRGSFRRRRRRLRFDAPPPRATALSGWALLPLRAFLGFTFCFAGLQKLANPEFFDAHSPSGIQAQLIASMRISPVHQLLGHLLQFAVPIGVVIALAELAVGLGALLGLWTRLAAVGGMVLAATLFLTVSFHSSPYYTGADIVFVFAWLPLVLAGSGGVLSLDAVIAARVAGEDDVGPPTLVPVRFAVVQDMCGSFDNDRCTAQDGRPCNVSGCPFLAAEPVPPADTPPARGIDRIDRRTVVLGGVAAAAAAVVGGVAAGLGRLAGGAQSPASRTVALAPGGSHGSVTTSPIAPTTAPASTSTPTSVPTLAPTTVAPSPPTTIAEPAGTRISPASAIPIGGAGSFTDPKSGNPGLVLQPSSGQFVAFDAICPHAGCTVAYSPGTNLIVCPCHGSEFDPRTGAVVHPPAQRGLTPIHVAVDASGDLVVDG